VEDSLAAIRRLYYDATPGTIGRDLALAVKLLKAMGSEEERERATVFMEGLAEMRREWARAAGKRAQGGGRGGGEQRRTRAKSARRRP
jgi:hypothetical protein